MAGFNIPKIPDIDWDGIFGRRADETLTPCTDGCGCETECEAQAREELLQRLADATISLAESNRILSELIDRIYAEA